jgi:hypothetical protein
MKREGDFTKSKNKISALHRKLGGNKKYRLCTESWVEIKNIVSAQKGGGNKK